MIPKPGDRVEASLTWDLVQLVDYYSLGRISWYLQKFKNNARYICLESRLKSHLFASTVVGQCPSKCALYK